MSVYKLHKKSRSGRRVEVRRERLEWDWPAAVACVLLALAIWLYLVNFPGIAESVPEETTPEVETTVDAADAPADATVEADLGRERA